MSDSEPVFVPQAPAVSNPARVKAVDDVYYGMEDASKVRAEQMAAITPGASVSDFKHTLITNLRDRQKPGDIAAVPPPPSPVSQAIAAGVGGFNGGAGMLPQYANIPLTGDNARQAVNAGHWGRVHEIVSHPIAVHKP